MNYSIIIFAIIFLYLFFVWVVLRLIVPHLGFRREPIPGRLPELLAQKIASLDAAAADNLGFLRMSYKFVTSRYTGGRMKTIFMPWRAFGDVYTKTPGFLACNGQNFLLRTVLVKSGRFSEDDIRIRTVPLNLFIHQYLQVKVENKWIYVDPWSHFRGIPLGKKSAFIG